MQDSNPNPKLASAQRQATNARPRPEQVTIQASAPSPNLREQRKARVAQPAAPQPRRRFQADPVEQPKIVQRATYVFFMSIAMESMDYSSKGLVAVPTERPYQGQLPESGFMKGDTIMDRAGQLWEIVERMHNLPLAKSQATKLYLIVAPVQPDEGAA